VTESGLIAVVYVKGDDPVLVAQATAAALDDALGDADPGLALEDVSGDDRGPAAAAESASTPPFLTDRRVVVLRDVGRFGAAEVAPLIDYLAAPLATSTVILAAGGGSVVPALTKAVQKAGVVIDAGVPRGKGRGSWVSERLRDSPVKVDAAAARLIDEHLGDDLGRLAPLLEVLAAAHGEGARIGPAEVEPFLGEMGGAAPWDLTDAIDKGDVAGALAQLHRAMGGAGRHPLVLIGSLHSHVARMARLDGAGVTSEADAAALLGIAAYPAKKALNQARRLGTERLLNALTLVADADVDVKGRSSWEPELVLEVLVARLTRLAGARRR
jgi:DNA polymerase-3 subunit delta